MNDPYIKGYFANQMTGFALTLYELMNPENIYWFKINNRNTRKRCETP